MEYIKVGTRYIRSSIGERLFRVVGYWLFCDVCVSGGGVGGCLRMGEWVFEDGMDRCSRLEVIGL